MRRRSENQSVHLSVLIFHIDARQTADSPRILWVLLLSCFGVYQRQRSINSCEYVCKRIYVCVSVCPRQMRECVCVEKKLKGPRDVGLIPHPLARSTYTQIHTHTQTQTHTYSLLDQSELRLTQTNHSSSPAPISLCLVLFFLSVFFFDPFTFWSFFHIEQPSLSLCLSFTPSAIPPPPPRDCTKGQHL